MTSAEKDCPCGRGPGHVRIKSAGCTPTAENDAPITEAACQRLRGYINQYEGMCWCGFESESLNDEGSTLDHIVHSLVDDWPNFLAATRVIPSGSGGING